MDDVAGAGGFMDGRRPHAVPGLRLKRLSSAKLLFLDTHLIPCDDRVVTSLCYKETDSHSYLNFKSSHPFKCKASIPANQFLRLRKICSEDDDLEEAATSIWRLSSSRVVTPSNLHRRENAIQPLYQQLFY